MLEYLRTVRDRPFWRLIPAVVADSFHEPLPQAPSPAEDVNAEFREKVLPYPTGNIPARPGRGDGDGNPGGDALRDARGRLVAYASREVHSSVSKAMELLGLGPSALREVAAVDDDTIDLAALRAAIADDRAAGNLPFLVVGCAGTVATGALDPLDALADPFSRGFRALKAWMALKEHGAARFGRIVQRNVEQARAFGERVATEPDLELLRRETVRLGREPEGEAAA